MYDLNDNNTAPQDQPRGLWENWSRRRILLLAGLLMGGNLFFQVWLYTMKEDLFLPVLGGAVGGVFLPLILVAQRHGFSLRRDVGLVDVRPAVLAALVFAAVHPDPWFIVWLVGVGIMLGFIFATTGSVTACWVAHALHNAISLWFMMSAQDGLAEPQAVTTPDWWLMAGSILGMVLVGKYLLVAGKRST